MQIDMQELRRRINAGFKYKIPADYSGFSTIQIPYKEYNTNGESKLVIVKKSHSNRGHRIYISCCGREIPAGRYVQHLKGHK